MLFLLTPTDAQPTAFALLERWIGEQDWPDGFRWIVGTRDASPYHFRMNQIHVERPETDGLHPLASNLLACFHALDMEPEDLALVIEHDDYYGPGYLSRMHALAEGVPLAGQTHVRYYHVGTRRYQQLHNSRHASLAQTAFRLDAIPAIREICFEGTSQIDLKLWRTWQGPKRLARSEEFIGIKGMPGPRGIGFGHALHFGRPDNGGRVFRAWGVPAEYEKYAWSKVE